MGLWRAIRNQWPKFWGNSVIKVGYGRKTMFWNDVWVGQTPLRQQFPDIYNLNQQNLATISEVKNAMHKVGISPSEDSSMTGKWRE
uniref:Putative ovule protein n=1 Tax=Solanum chacoense TaxID=4108 RepID=A0A0V0GK97_SOLCH